MPTRRKSSKDADDEKSSRPTRSSSRQADSEDEKVKNEDVEEAPVRREQPKRTAKSPGVKPSEPPKAETKPKPAPKKASAVKKTAAAKKSSSTKPPRAKRAKVEKVESSENDSGSNDEDCAYISLTLAYFLFKQKFYRQIYKANIAFVDEFLDFLTI